MYYGICASREWREWRSKNPPFFNARVLIMKLCAVGMRNAILRNDLNSARARISHTNKTQYRVKFPTCICRFKQPLQWVIRAGEFDLTQKENSEQNIRAEAIYVHSSYISATNENDIALVYLEKPAQVNDTVDIICLPDEGDVQPGSSCASAGWGFTPNLHHTSAPLRSQVVPVVSRQECNKFSSYGGLVKEGMICAGFEKGGKDNCYGDGGSPLMCQISQGKWVVGGINSWGQGCGLPGKYSVYTFTEKYRHWINRHLQAN